MAGKIRRTPRRRTPARPARELQLFVIATEDAHAARQYFHALARNRLIDFGRLRFKVLDTGPDGRSAPQHVTARLDDYRADHPDLVDGLDEMWLVIDVDRWPDRSLSDVATRASQKNYCLAVTNPCIELWLLLHFTDDLTALTAHATAARQCAACARGIRDLVGSYNKTNLVPERYHRAAVTAAIARAHALDAGSPDRWPQTLGSHVYKLVEKLLIPPHQP